MNIKFSYQKSSHYNQLRTNQISKLHHFNFKHQLRSHINKKIKARKDLSQESPYNPPIKTSKQAKKKKKKKKPEPRSHISHSNTTTNNHPDFPSFFLNNQTMKTEHVKDDEYPNCETQIAKRLIFCEPINGFELAASVDPKSTFSNPKSTLEREIQSQIWLLLTYFIGEVRVFEVGIFVVDSYVTGCVVGVELDLILVRPKPTL
jgi:hypothetical protein